MSEAAESPRKRRRRGYAEAAAELDAILEEIETGEADVDVLSAKVARAAELIRACREQLTRTELEVRKVVEELAAEEETAEGAEGSTEADDPGAH